MVRPGSKDEKAQLLRSVGIATPALLRALYGGASAFAIAALAYRMRFNLSTAGSIELLLVVLVALRWDLLQASVMSVVAVLCLDYFFTQPLFEFNVDQPADWIALAAFETVALLASMLSSKVRAHAARAEVQRSRIAKLYELSKAILLIDVQHSTANQLAALIRELMQVAEVDIRVFHEESSKDPASPQGEFSGSSKENNSATEDSDDPGARASKRILRLGTTPIGTMVLSGWEPDPMMADAVASLAAVALERTRSLEKENRAEAGRQTEQLRTAVLDGLAHAFKTPLTAILTASSGLLEIGALTPTQAELISLIDEEALTLNNLTTRLLQTAALESREIRLRTSPFAVVGLIDEILRKEGAAMRDRVNLTGSNDALYVNGDSHLVRLALAQLIDNAAKYSSVGTKIDISVRQQGSETFVVVGNSGSTIPKEERERIFERFYRGSNASHGPTGTGLGLSIVRKTAEAHQGRTWVECDGERTNFFFTMQSDPGVQRG